MIRKLFSLKKSRTTSVSPRAVVTQEVPLPSGLIAIRSPDQLLGHVDAFVSEIQALMVFPDDQFQALILPALRQFAALVQQLPASEAHHHAHAGGMLEHTCEVVVNALKLRRGLVLPPGTPAEALGAVRHAWTYGTFVAALMHDVGKPLVDQRVALFGRGGHPLGEWEPWRGPMTDRADAVAYRVGYHRDRVHRFHESAGLVVLPQIIGGDGLHWLGSDRALLRAVLGAIQGDEDSGPLADLIRRADGESVARALGGGGSARISSSRVVPLHEKIITATRVLIERGELPINRNGANGFVHGGSLWLVSKVFADKVRAQLTAEGHSGVPTRNERFFDVLQEHGILRPCGDRAIWRATVRGDTWSHQFTLVCIPVSVVFADPDSAPAPFTGVVEPLDAALSESMATPATPATPAPTGIELGSADEELDRLLATNLTPAAVPSAVATGMAPVEMPGAQSNDLDDLLELMAPIHPVSESTAPAPAP
ncbi:MAG: TraI domain-containing protein, partial [Gammaproteobacteria bacterium]|nr:TraI domain-containing protein [Gammaproteobacteria bacterium]